jgi:hypothetical protein
MAFGYPTINGQNNITQQRRAVDMIYQRGATYDVTLTGSTYEDSMELVVDMYNKDVKVGQMSIVPYEVTLSGGTYYYQFGIRPYDYMSNYIESEHYTQTNLSTAFIDFLGFNLVNNVQRTKYKNITKANYKYGYRYYSGNTLITEYSGNTPTNDYVHTFNISPLCNLTNPQFAITGTTQPTGQYFDYVGGQLQMDEHLFLPNYDQEMGVAMQVGGVTGMTLTTDYERNLSPTSQFIFSYPRTPYQSEISRFLTDAPRIQYVTENDSYSLYYLQGQTGDRKMIEADYVNVRMYDVNNTQVYNINIQIYTSFGTTFNPYSNVTGFTDTLDVWSLPCGPSDIDNIYDQPFTINWSTVAYYTVQIIGSYPADVVNQGRRNVTVGPVVPVSETFYFYLNTNCLPQDTRVVWLNNRGGYDYYTFTAYRQDTKKITRQTYDNRQYQTNPNSPDRNIGRTIKTFATDVEQEIVLESDFLTLADGNWIEQLFYSPQVYIMKGDYISQVGPNSILYKDLVPTQVLSTEVETITKKHQKLNKYKITMKVANNFFVNKGF